MKNVMLNASSLLVLAVICGAAGSAQAADLAAKPVYKAPVVEAWIPGWSACAYWA